MDDAPRFRIAISGWARTVALGKAAFIAFVGASLVAVAATADNNAGVLNPFADLTDDELAATRATLVVFALACFWMAFLYCRPGFTRTAYVELGPNALVVHHGGLLTKPLSIPRESIKAVAIDPRQWRWRWVGNKGRFHLATQPSDGGPPEWLFSVIGGSPFPLLSNVDDVPNLAFLFSEPVRMQHVRRAARMFASKNPVHVPVQGRDVRGLLVKVKDVAAAEGSLASWTTVRPLTTDDVAAGEPDAAYKAKAKKRRRTANVWLGILLFVQFGLPAIATVADQSIDEEAVITLAP